MRILFLSSFYPPLHIGGYPQWCYEVVEALKERGHTTRVLTSRYRSAESAAERGVLRLLHLEADLNHYQPLHFFKRWRRERRENFSTVERVTAEFKPDLVFIWGMWGLAKSLAAQAERLLPSRVVYFLCDYWPADVDMHTAYWTLPARHWFTSIPRWLLAKTALSLIGRTPDPELRLEKVICVSAAVRDILVKRGLALGQVRVIYGGTRVNGFQSIRERDFKPDGLKLLYAGQLVAHKGVHTAIEAISELANRRGLKGVTLDIVGSGNPEYENLLRRLVAEKKLEEYVSFKGSAAREDMPRILAAADILVFPSIYEEPFARMTQEAMLAGLVVVATTTGGTKEIVHDGKNGLTFEADDATALADCIMRLVRDPALCRRLAEEGRRTVLENFTLDRMVDGIEGYLKAVCNSEQPEVLQEPVGLSGKV